MNLFISDLPTILYWYLVISVIGIIFFPLCSRLFKSFPDLGYPVSKILGTALIGYSVWLLASLHVAPFTLQTILVVVLAWLGINALIVYKSTINKPKHFSLAHFIKNSIPSTSQLSIKLLLFEEILFLAAFLFWTFVRGHEPSLHSLEKYMDYGFMNSIGISQYFPPQDMWLTPSSDSGDLYKGGFFINYYYFGHYITAFLTKLTGIASEVTYNLMLSTLFAFCWTASFGIGITLLKHAFQKIKYGLLVFGGILSGFLVTMAGNLHTIYIFTSGYPNETPVPFWQILKLSWNTSYWYPNATRFIPNTIHEFPSYSWVVADLHGHVLDIPFVLLTLALLLSFFLTNEYRFVKTILLGLMTAVMYMTNAWDGLIYLGLSMLVLITSWLITNHGKNSHKKGLLSQYQNIATSAKYGSFLGVLILILGFALFTFPFNIHFKPFVSGFGVVGGWEIARALNLIPENAEQVVKMGPFLLEKGNNLRSPLWMLGVLWGFFYFFVVIFAVFLIRSFKSKAHHSKLLSFAYWKETVKTVSPVDLFLLLLIIISTMLLIFPEFFYAKDIYPAHYRANTMFKLGYQAYMMLSLVSAFTFMKLSAHVRGLVNKPLGLQALRLVSSILIILVGIYSYFGIQSYYGVWAPVNRPYEGQDGIAWIKTQYPGDYAAIEWFRNLPKNNKPTIILEAVGESYTDYARISAYTGMPTIVGWPVHEWLWRGSYDEPGKRDGEVKLAYEISKNGDISPLTSLLKKYDVKYIVVGPLERQKYTALNEEAIKSVSTPVFSEGETTIYEVK